MKKLASYIAALALLVGVSGFFVSAVRADTESPEIYVRNIVLSGNEGKSGAALYAPGATVKGTFDLINGRASDNPDVHYIVFLTGVPDKNSNASVYDKVSFGPVYVPGRQTKNVAFAYTLPKAFAGIFNIRIQAVTQSELLLGWWDSKIAISGKPHYADITSAKVVVNGKNYFPQEGPTVTTSKPAELKLVFKNISSTKLQFTPAVSVFDRSITGTLLKEYNDQPISLEAGESKTVSLSLPIFESKPGVYTGYVKFMGADKEIQAPTIAFRYIMSGDIGVIQYVRTDKASIVKDETISLSLRLNGTPRDIARNSVKKELGAVVFSATVFNEKDEVVANFTKNYSFTGASAEEINDTLSAPAQVAGTALRVDAHLTKGEASLGGYSAKLAANFDETSAEAKAEALRQKIIFMVVIPVVVIALGLVALALWRRKKIGAALVVLFVLGSVYATGAHKTFAFTTTSSNGMSLGQFNSPMSGENMDPSYPFYINGSVQSSTCSNHPYNDIVITATLRGQGQTFTQTITRDVNSDTRGEWHNFRLGQFIAPPTPGTYYIDISAISGDTNVSGYETIVVPLGKASVQISNPFSILPVAALKVAMDDVSAWKTSPNTFSDVASGNHSFYIQNITGDYGVYFGTCSYKSGTTPCTVSPAIDIKANCTANDCRKNGIGVVPNQTTAVFFKFVPAPTVDLVATPTSVNYGTNSKLTWTSQYADICSSSDFATGAAVASPAGGVATANLTTTKTYTITCSNQYKTATDSVTVTVTQPPTVTLTASPTPVDYNTPTTLTWTSTNASSCTSFDFATGNATSNGAGVQSARLTANKEFSITCTGAGGATTKDNVTVLVRSDVGGSCSSSPTAISKGGTATWTVNPTGGTGTYSYAWSGSDSLSGTAKSVTKMYSALGVKTASVVVTSGAVSKTIDCSNSLSVTDLFTYSLSNSGNLTVTKPATGTVSTVATIAVKLDSGTPRPVTLSIAGLPTGATASFAGSISVFTPTAAPTLTIVVPSTVTAGTYPITISGTGDDAASSRTTTFSLIVQNPPPVAVDPPAAPVPVAGTANACGGNVIFSWNTVVGATSYKIYDYTGVTLLRTVTATSYTDVVPPSGSYAYYVSAFNSVTNLESTKSRVVVTSSVACNFTVSLVANPATGVKPLTSVLTATIANNNTTGTASYQFRCKASDALSTAQSSSVYSCTYSTPGTYTASVVVTKGGLVRPADVTIVVNDVPPPQTTYSCTGGIPQYASSCGNDTNLTQNTPYTRVATCGTGKCTFYCPSTYSWDGTSCVPPVVVSPTAPNPQPQPAACGGNIAFSWSPISNVSYYKIYDYSGRLLTQITQSSFSGGGLVSGNQYGFYVSALDATLGAESSRGYVVVTGSAACAYSVSLVPNPASGFAPLTSTLTANITSDNTTGNPSYKFKCNTADAYSAAQNSRTFTCTYTNAGTYSPSVEVTKQNIVRTATASVTANSQNFSCINLPASGVTNCGNSTGLTQNTPYTHVSACGTSPCTYACAPGYAWNGTSCVAATYSCTGLPAHGFDCGNNSGLIQNTAFSYVPSCGTAQCTYRCADGYVMSNGACVQALTAPAPVQGSASCGAFVTFSWQAISGATKYKVYDYTGTLVLQDSAATTFTAGPFLPGGLYGYDVSAYNATVESAKTHIVVTASAACATYSCTGSKPATAINCTDNSGLNQNMSYTYVPTCATVKCTFTCPQGYSGANCDINGGGGGTAPTVTLVASPTTVAYNGTSLLTWTSAHTDTCAGNGFNTGSVTANSTGVSTGQLTQSKTYSITCTGPGGTANSSATVTVNTATATFTCQPENPATPTVRLTQAPVGSPVRWAAYGENLDGKLFTWTGSAPATGVNQTSVTKVYTTTGRKTESLMIDGTTVQCDLGNFTVSSDPTYIEF